MSEKDGLGSKILGLFVEKPDDGASTDPTKSPAEQIAELAKKTGAVPGEAAKPLPKIALPADAKPAQLDFSAIFRDAGMDAAELDRVNKAEELLRGLPEGTPQEVKKQIVETSLRAFGFAVEKIVLAAQNQQKALDTYVRLNETATAKGISDAEAQMKQLSEKIEALKQDIHKRTHNLASVAAAAQARKEQVQRVLEFFAVSAAPAAPKP